MERIVVVEELRKMHKEGLSDHEIGRRLGVKSTAIWYWRKKLGLKRNFAPGYFSTTKRISRVAVAFLSHYNIPQTTMARILKCDPASIYLILKELGIKRATATPYEIVCEWCGVIFSSHVAHTKRCPDCRKEHDKLVGETYYLTSTSRRTLSAWSRDARRELREQIIEEDGEEIANLVMNGMGTPDDRYSWEKRDSVKVTIYNIENGSG